MKAKRISINVTAEGQLSVTEARTTIEGVFAGCRSMTGLERRRLNKLGDQSEAFVRDIIALSKVKIGLMPRDLDVALLEQDLVTLEYLRNAATEFRILLERIDHSEMLLGSDIMGATLEMYNILQKNGDQAGISDVLREIGKRFAKKKALTDPVTPKPTPAPVEE